VGIVPVNLLLKLAGAALSIGLAFGVNQLTRPEFDPHYDDAEYSQAAGTLTLSHAGGTLEIPLMATHIVTVDVERFGRSYKVRELTLRAAGSGTTAPRVELFASLSSGGGDLLGGAHDPAVLLQSELPIVRSGRLGARRSLIVLEGTQPSEIVTGNMLLTDVTQVSAGERPDYHAEGRIEVQVQTARGVDMVTGKWSGRLCWDATGT
jgi:hypothetical protein